jgi:four helix bundle protein
MTREEMTARTKRFAVDVLRYCSRLPGSEEARIISRQLMQSATSAGANYRAAQRGRSRSEFVVKLGIVEAAADESLYWLELLDELDAGHADERQRLHREATELLRIVVAARKSAKGSR